MQVSCDLCSGDETIIVCRPLLTVAPVLKCINCGLVYVNPQPEGQEVFSKLGKKYQDLGLSFEYESRWRDLRFIDKLKIIQSYKEAGKLLDIGCGPGVFLEIARETYDCYGVDTNPVHCQKTKNERGLKVFNGTLKEVKFKDEFFDVIVALNVLEHTFSPMQELIEINRTLKRGGILLLEILNIQSIWFKIFRKKWRQFLPDHYFYFSPKTIIEYLRKSGFKIIKIGYDKKFLILGI